MSITRLTVARHSLTLGLLLLIGLGLRLNVIGGEVEALVRVMPDDAYYYLGVARHVAAGAGSTFDGIHATNGYHPLWLLSLLPLTGLDSLTLARAALTLGAVFSLGSALILQRVLRRAGASDWLAACGVGLYFIWPPTVLNSLNGLETGLTTLLFAAAFYVSVIAVDRSPGYEFALGALLGGLFLARTDTAFYAAALGLLALKRAAPGRRWRRAVLSGGLALLVVSPWLLWNWLNFGAIVQASGMALPYVIHANYDLAGHSTVAALGQSAIYLVSFLLSGGTLIWAGVIGWVAARIGRDAASPILRMALWLYPAALLLIFVHAFIRWYPRAWYFDQIDWLGVLTVILSLDAVVRSRGVISNPIGQQTPTGLIVIAGLIAIALSAAAYRELAIGPYPWQVEALDGARWLAANLSPDQSAAAFNAGIYGYFSDRRVVNLDGVINQTAFEAVQRRELLAFMRQAGVDYYLDHDPVLWRVYQAFWGEVTNLAAKTQVAVFDRPGVDFHGDPVRVYRLAWR